MSDLIVGDIGARIELRLIKKDGTAFDISAATTKTFIFVKGDGSSVTKTAVFVTAGVDGKLQYTTIAGDIDQPGPWRVRAQVISASYDRKTEFVSLEVAD